MDALGETVVADVALPLVLLRAIEPHDAFVDEPPEDLGAHEVGDRGLPSGRDVCDRG